MVKSFVARACRWLLRHVETYDTADMTAAEKSRSVWEYASQFLRCLDDLPELTSPAPQSDPVKIIWQFWWQGASEAPLIVKRCMESVRRMCKGYQVILVDKNNIHEYLDLPEHMVVRFRGREGTGAFSDYVRYALLARHGGVWLDATVYLTEPLPENLLQATYFSVCSCYWKCCGDEVPNEFIIRQLDSSSFPNNTFLAATSWFLGAKRGSRSVIAIRRLLEKYWLESAESITYLLVQYFQTLIVWYADSCKAEWLEMPKYEFSTPNVMQKMLSVPFDVKLSNEIKRISSFHKLSYKHLEGLSKVLPDGRETLLGRILKGEQL